MDGIIVVITKNTRVPGTKKLIRIGLGENFEKILSDINAKLKIDAKICTMRLET